MASSRDTLRELDRQILDGLGAAGLTDEALIGGVRVPGYFRDGYVELGTGDETVEAREITFDCRAEDLPQIAIDDPITVTGQGEFRLARIEPADGTGRRLLTLGTFL